MTKLSLEKVGLSRVELLSKQGIRSPLVYGLSPSGPLLKNRSRLSHELV